MTKREAGAQMIEQCNRLYSMAFATKTNNLQDLIDLKMKVNSLWAEVDKAAEDRVIFKQDAEICYSCLREAFRWIRFRRKQIQN